MAENEEETSESSETTAKEQQSDTKEQQSATKEQRSATQGSFMNLLPTPMSRTDSKSEWIPLVKPNQSLNISDREGPPGHNTW